MKESINMEEILQILSPNKLLIKPIDYLKTADAIEHFLIDTYDQEEYAQRTWNLYEERRSLMTASLYNQILMNGKLPTVSEFIHNYLLENAYLPDVNAERYYANLGYLSLVTDLHFYFILKGSELFDSVTMDYEYDLSAYTDIFITIDSQTIGLQLFSGNDQSQLGKEHQLSLDRSVRSYQIYLFSRKSKEGVRKEIHTKTNKIVQLYSKEDAKYWAEFLKVSRQKSLYEFNETILNEQCDIFLPASNLKKLNSNYKKVKLEDDWVEILQLVKHSIFIIGKDKAARIPDEFKEALKMKGIQLYLFDIPDIVIPSEFKQHRIIIDGMLNNKYITAQQYQTLHPFFEKSKCNIFQYEVEHYDPSSDILVAAGAGSGKTHTLISRTLFLINTGKVKSLKEIAMITFTNETADQMREKLAERFFEQYKMTGDSKFLTYLEEIQEMKISTIPSFAKNILMEFGQFIGLGTEMKISKLTMQRREIIEGQLDKSLKADFSIKDFGKLPHHEIISFIERIWEKIEQKGLSPDDFTDEKEVKLYQLLIQILKGSEVELADHKISKNTLTLADLTRYLKKLLEKNVPLVRLKNKITYLFVDEFQDTDNSQIDFISQLALKAQIPLLVVGDVKQSIYRFRGANATAFDELTRGLKVLSDRKVHKINLRYNYRTTNELLDNLERIFSIWRKGTWLPQGDLAMISARKEAIYIGEKAFEKKAINISKNEILSYYRELLSQSKVGEEPPTIAILVRTNREAIQIGEILEEIKKETDLMCDVQLEGTLFQSIAAKDLLLLLESWMSPTDKNSIYSFSETAFCRGSVKRASVKLKDTYVVEQQQQVSLPDSWFNALDQLKFNPTILVLNDFLSKVPYMENLENEGIGEDERIKYQLNLYKILMHLYSSLEDQNDLFSLYDWLALQVATNREEDEAELNAAQFDKPLIKVMTVHKSKGLEFHTVIIPFTKKNFIQTSPIVENNKVNYSDKPFKYKNAKYNKSKYIDIIIQTAYENNDIKNQLGWFFAEKNSEFDTITNLYYELKSKEDQEAAREEARVFYVALTRAKERCIVYQINSKQSSSSNKPPKSWAELLLMEDK